MARFNEILAPRYNRFLQKLFGVKGEAPVPVLGSEIMPIFAVFGGAENRYLEGWNRFGASIFIAAGAAGKNSQLRLRNPTVSNVIGVVEKCTLWTGGTSEYALQLGQPTTDLGTAQSSATKPFDGRIGSTTGSNLILSSDNTITGAGQIGADIWDVTQVANTPYDVIWDENQELVITPGWCIAAVLKAAAQSFGVNVWWRERFLEESERA